MQLKSLGKIHAIADESYFGPNRLKGHIGLLASVLHSDLSAYLAACEHFRYVFILIC